MTITLTLTINITEHHQILFSCSQDYSTLRPGKFLLISYFQDLGAGSQSYYLLLFSKIYVCE